MTMVERVHFEWRTAWSGWVRNADGTKGPPGAQPRDRSRCTNLTRASDYGANTTIASNLLHLDLISVGSCNCGSL